MKQLNDKIDNLDKRPTKHIDFIERVYGSIVQYLISPKKFLGKSMINIHDCGWCNKLRNWAIDTAQCYLTIIIMI